MDNTNTIEQTVSGASAPLSASPSVEQNSGGNDISKTTIAVLVLLTLMISIIGTWTVLNEISAVKLSSPKPAASVGQVQLVIGGNPTNSKSLADTTGRVSLQIDG